MANYFRDRFRISSDRKPDHDYSSAGAYFVTQNTESGIRWFGSIKRGKVQLSAMGQIVAEEWERIAELRENIIIDEWVLMPDHLHGIIIIKDNEYDTKTFKNETTQRLVSTIEKYRINELRLFNSPGLKPNTLGSIMGQFKSMCTKRIRKNSFKYFKWQRGYYDHIITSEN
jgi:REP element-mobilizing transposase RayT